VSTGKGVTVAQSVLSALSESYERWAAEPPGDVALGAGELEAAFRELPVAAPSRLRRDSIRSWCVGWDLAGRSPCLIPCAKVYFPFAEASSTSSLQNDTNGLAAGIDPLEATCWALLEVVERHCLGCSSPATAKALDIETVPPELAAICERFTGTGIEIALWDVSAIPGVTCALALSNDTRLAAPGFFCFGSAAHPSRTVAFTRALTEMAQNRVGRIATLRHDMHRRIERTIHIDYVRRVEALTQWLRPARSNDWERGPEPSFANSLEFADQLISSISGVRRAGPIGLVVLREEPGMAAVRVYCPTLIEARE
jgi:YcaO-like protein with predicted kinase domain